MGASPYRAVEDRGPAADSPVRVVEGGFGSFAAGERCLACGASGAHPAQWCEGDGYLERSKTLEDYPGRIALCESCAAVQDRALRRLDLWRWLYVAPLFVSLVAQWFIIEWLPTTGLVARETLAMVALFVAMMLGVRWWLVRLSRRTLLPAIVVGGHEDQIMVQLATPSAIALPPRATRPSVGDVERGDSEKSPNAFSSRRVLRFGRSARGFVGLAPERYASAFVLGFCFGVLGLVANLTTPQAFNRRVLVNHGSTMQVVVGERTVLGASLLASDWFFYVRGSSVRLDFLGPIAVEPLVLPNCDATLNFLTPSCEARTRDGELEPVVYRFESANGEYRLRCPRADSASPNN